MGQALRGVWVRPWGSAGLSGAGTQVVMVDRLGSSYAQPARGLAAGFAAGGAGAKVHLYGKEVRPGRKLGHVTVVGPSAHEAEALARAAVAALRGAG